MLSADVITAWAVDHPWPARVQVEQDLLLSRAICAIATDDYLGNELVFRGGTALHKLHLPKPLRYSEDLDYVRSTGSGIRQLTERLFHLGRDLGFDVRSKITEHPKFYWRTTSQVGTNLRLKIEINTHERSPAKSLIRRSFVVESSWWAGQAEVSTFQLAELIATKLRALFQRSRGRDLFDIWLALTATDLDPDQVIAAFGPYRPAGYTAKRAVANLQAKLAAPDFRHDLDALASQPPESYDADQAADLVTKTLLWQL